MPDTEKLRKPGYLALEPSQTPQGLLIPGELTAVSSPDSSKLGALLPPPTCPSAPTLQPFLSLKLLPFWQATAKWENLKVPRAVMKQCSDTEHLPPVRGWEQRAAQPGEPCWCRFGAFRDALHGILRNPLPGQPQTTWSLGNHAALREAWLLPCWRRATQPAVAGRLQAPSCSRCSFWALLQGFSLMISFSVT